MDCFFFVIDEHESVIILIGLKVNHFFCDVEVQIGRLKCDAQISMSTASDIASSQNSKRRVAAEKPSDFFFYQGRT